MKIVVIGGGVAGLSCALALADRGADVTVLEREPIAGGKVGSERKDGWLVERGPAGVLDNSPATKELYQRLNLSSEVVVSDDAARHRFVLKNGKLREVSPSPLLLFSPLLPWSALWRVIREPKAPPAPEGVDETVAEFVRRRFGGEIAAGLAEPMVSGIFAGDYAKLSVASAFPKIVEMERQHGSLLRALRAAGKQRKQERRPREIARLTTLKSGMGALPAALSRELGSRLRTGVTVRSIERGKVRFSGEAGEGEIAADHVVLALPSGDAAELVKPLDAELAAAFAGIPTAGIAALALGYARGDVSHSLNGFGFLVPRLEQVRLLGSIWMSSTFPAGHQAPEGHVLIRCMIGGAHDPEAVTLSDDELLAIAREGLRLAIGLTNPPRFVHVQKWRRGIAQYEVGHAARVEKIEARIGALGMSATGAALRGVGVNDVIREARVVAERLSAK